MTTRQQILDRLAGRLTSIAPGVVFYYHSGSSHTCTSTIRQVRPWRKNPYSLVELPAIAYRDGVTRLESREHGKPYRYRLQAKMAVYLAGTAPASIARAAMLDMLAAVGSDPRCGGLAHKVELLGCRLLVQQTADVVAAGLLEVAITFTPANGEVVQLTGNTLTSDGEALTSDGEALTW